MAYLSKTALVAFVVSYHYLLQEIPIQSRTPWETLEISPLLEKARLSIDPFLKNQLITSALQASWSLIYLYTTIPTTTMKQTFYLLTWTIYQYPIHKTPLDLGLLNMQSATLSSYMNFLLFKTMQVSFFLTVNTLAQYICPTFSMGITRFFDPVTKRFYVSPPDLFHATWALVAGSLSLDDKWRNARLGRALTDRRVRDHRLKLNEGLISLARDVPGASPRVPNFAASMFRRVKSLVGPSAGHVRIGR